MSSFQSLLKVLKTIDALPESMYNSVVPHFDNECEACLDAIKTGLTKCLCEETAFDLEDYTKEQAQEFFSCMAGGSIDKADMRECLVEERGDEDDRTVLESLCHVDATHDSRCLSVLKHLRGLDVFRQSDIIDMRLLQCSCKVQGTLYCKEEEKKAEEKDRMNTCIFHFLVEWDPTALNFIGENKRTDDFYGDFLLGEVLYNPFPIETKTLVFKAGLKHFPHDLGLLTLHCDSYEPFIWTLDRCKEGIEWIIIEECFWKVGGHDLNLHEPDPRTNLYPFMTATRFWYPIELVYCLLRKDPSVLLHFDSGGERQRDIGGKRKRTES